MSTRLVGSIETPDYADLEEATRRIDTDHDDHTDRWDANGASHTLRVTTERILLNDEGPGHRQTMPGLTRANLTIVKDRITHELERHNYSRTWLVIRRIEETDA